MKKKILTVVAIIAVTILVIVAVVCVTLTLHSRNERVVETLPIEETEVQSTEEIKYAVPSEPVTDTFVNERKDKEITYSDTTICATFAEDIRGMCEQVFGEYLPPLQDAYAQLEEAGYEYFTAFTSDSDTAVFENDYLEFTIYLPGARGRITILNEGGDYTTTFRILNDDEYLSASLFEPDGIDAEVETE